MAERKFSLGSSWLWALVWGCIILFLSLQPGGPGQFNFLGIPHFDKIGHFGMYAIWTFLLFRAMSFSFGMSRTKAFLLSVLIGTLTGILLELGQLMMAQGRSYELADMGANGLGALAGAGAALLFGERRFF